MDAVLLLAFELLRRVLDRAVLDRVLPDDPLLFVDLFVLELPRDELLLEDRVVCAIVISPLLAFRASSAFRAGGSVALPAELEI